MNPCSENKQVSLYRMNDHYYDIIISYLPLYQRPIVQRKYRHLMGERKKLKYLPFYVNIILHAGSTCFKYCVCRIIDEKEKYECYQNMVSYYN